MDNYNVYVIDADTFEAVKLCGSNLGFEKANFLSYAVERNLDLLKSFVGVYLEGSDRDIECKNNLKNE